MDFTWDNQKAIRNLRKHGVSFEEAGTAFADPRHDLFFDPEHSDEEDRYILLGMSRRGRLLVVCHTERGSFTRLTSARLATSRERRDYEKMDKPEDLEDDMRPEYDFSKMKSLGRGKYAERIRKEGKKITVTRTVAFDEDIEKAFPTSEAVNEALRGLMNAQTPSATP